MIGHFVGYDTEERISRRAPEGELIVAMCTYGGEVYVATQHRVYRLEHTSIGEEYFKAMVFAPLPSIKRLEE